MLRFALREFDIMSRLHCGFPIVADICSTRFAHRSKLVIFDENPTQLDIEMRKHQRYHEKKREQQQQIASQLQEYQQKKMLAVVVEVDRLAKRQ